MLKRKNSLLLILTLLFTANYIAGQTNYYTSVRMPVGVLTDNFFSALGEKNAAVDLINVAYEPADRNAISPLLAGKNNSHLQLADSLAKNGIASLRFDKRGIGKNKFQIFERQFIV